MVLNIPPTLYQVLCAIHAVLYIHTPGVPHTVYNILYAPIYDVCSIHRGTSWVHTVYTTASVLLPLHDVL